MRAKNCPCGLGELYADCCGRFHEGAKTAPTAELLMRSRFCAFAVADTGYLLRTWHSSTRPRTLWLGDEQRWTRLEILGRTGGGLLHTEGTVEFRAHYVHQGQPDHMHENSSFVREDGQWLYVEALG
ncbi:YchJ family protein [Amycolatopsis sp. H20-H5]|uniref:YchJ family protein n=1 Tax=Amycolatopsis sp. H20-H5 TaxID=3046309 RepID=UPI002DBF233B|nr:YchJ family metal-binding protein [Amycolatopsis sp. H20-H5]MEC3974105.1 YchJ family metal-binding protein [Amycolatopsis sp. H20-H5]